MWSAERNAATSFWLLFIAVQSLQGDSFNAADAQEVRPLGERPSYLGVGLRRDGGDLPDRSQSIDDTIVQ